MGFLQVGPQYYPPRTKGVQVIQRGPHGMRFAADPIYRGPGRGFTWWSEQMIQAGDYKQEWTPQQKVVGLLGLGSDFTEGLKMALIPGYGLKAAMSPEAAPAPAPTRSQDNGYLDAARSGIKSAKTQADFGNFSEAQKGISFARSQVNKIGNTSLRATGENELAQAVAYVARAQARSPKDQAMSRAGHAAAVQQQQAAAKAETERALREQREGSWTDPTTWGRGLVPDSPAQLWESVGSGVKKAVVVGGVVLLAAPFLYGLGSGLGSRGRQ